MKVNGIPVTDRMFGKRVTVDYEGHPRPGVITGFDAKPFPQVYIQFRANAPSAGYHPDAVFLYAEDYDVLDAYYSTYPFDGCSDGSCRFKKPNAGGQHTNGGCRCLRSSGSSAHTITQSMAVDFEQALQITDQLYHKLVELTNTEEAKAILSNISFEVRTNVDS